ncbi:MAG: alcohol dehydrogenase catalytic domain-containing protein [Anaerolineae bacterium]
MGKDTMKAAVLYGKGDIRVETIPRPEIGENEVLVKVRYCNICGSDLRTYVKGPSPRYKLPLIMGHEFSGDVVESKSPHFKPGDRVTAEAASACGYCFYCRIGEENLCQDSERYGIYTPGALAEYIRISAHAVSRGSLFKLPSDLSYEEATLVEPLACCLRGLLKAEIKPGDTVVILGDGPIGLMHTRLARWMGAGKIIVGGHHPERLRLAREWGADYALNTHEEEIAPAVAEATGGIGAAAVIAAAGNAQVLEEGLKLLRGAGSLIGFSGLPPETIARIDPNPLHYREFKFIGSFSCTQKEFLRALNLVHHLDITALLTHRVSLENIVEGFEIAASKKGLRVLVEILNI